MSEYLVENNGLETGFILNNTIVNDRGVPTHYLNYFFSNSDIAFIKTNEFESVVKHNFNSSWVEVIKLAEEAWMAENAEYYVKSFKRAHRNYKIVFEGVTHDATEEMVNKEINKARLAHNRANKAAKK